MKPLRSIATVLGFAAITTAAAVTVFWPKATLADGDDDKAGMVLDGTKVNHVVVEGEAIKDAKSKTGWVIELKAVNNGAEEETADLETDLTRQLSNPMSRAQPMPTAVFKKKEKITVAAGQTVTRRYEVPAAIAVQMNAAAAAQARLEKAYEQGKNPQLKPIAYFNVAFKGPWTDEEIAMPTNRKLALAPRKVSPSRL